MRLKTVSLVAAAAALSTASIAAQAASRDVAPVEGESEIGGTGTTQLVVLAVIAAVIFAGIQLTDDDDPLSV